MADRPHRFRLVHFAIGVLLASAATLGAGQIAAAHTDFDSSVPTDGAVVDGPLTEIVLNFTNPAQPSGEGFVLLDPTGTVRTPTSVNETDGTSFVLAFEPALEAGTYGLRWEVQAGDAHPIDGSLRFDVAATLTEVTSAPTASTVDSSTSTTVDGRSADSTAAPSTPTEAGELQVDIGAPPTGNSGATASLDEFLDAASSTGGSAGVGRIGRTITILGTIFGVGVLAALTWTIRGNREELDTQLAWIRLAGIAVFVGGFVEFAALNESDSTATIGSLLTAQPGIATVLKMIGGLAAFVGFHSRAGRIVAPAHSLSAAVATDLDDRSVEAGESPSREHQWTPTSSAALGCFGYALVLASFWFDGHTVSKGPWVFHALANLVHLGAAAVWGGGVFAMTTVAWMRRRRSERVGLAAMVIRFSSLAAISLTTVILAGLLMTWMVLDSPSDLFGTEWGRILMAKMAVVAIAAGLGGFNHFRLRPALEVRPDDPALARELRISLSIESAAFVAVVALTAVLVASAT